MQIIVDSKIPLEAKENLSRHGEVIDFMTEGPTYPAISGHPDVFFCVSPDITIVAPNLPEQYVRMLEKAGIPFLTGEFPVGKEYPETARYNAVATDKYLIHNFRHTDFMITRTFEDHTPIHVDQGYCRCNLFPLKDDHFITSDEGIFKVMKHHTDNILKVNPEGILLEGFPNGFFGGCCGVFEDKVFVLGTLKYFHEGEQVKNFLKRLDYEVIELYDGPLFDGGGILFLGA